MLFCLFFGYCRSRLSLAGALPDFESLLRGISCLASPPPLSVPSLDLLLQEKDSPVLASAIRHRCQALLSGDKTHFGRLYGQPIAGVFICSPQVVAEILAGVTGANGGMVNRVPK